MLLPLARSRSSYSPVVELAEATAAGFVRHAYNQMLVVAERLGDDKVSMRPLGAGTNAVAGLIVHCCGMAEFWLGHVALGRPSTRDRDAEFTATATLSELRALLENSIGTIVVDLARIQAGEAIPGHEARAHLIGGGSDDSVVLHVIEELFQHLGHMELAGDALLREGPP